jgi:hypothetical protein
VIVMKKPRRTRPQTAQVAKLKWKPWTDDPKPGTGDFLTDEMLQGMIGAPCRAAYAYMFKTREQQIADFEDPKAAKLLMELHGMWEATASDMQDLINMVRGASARLLIAACASIEKKKQEKRRGSR